MIMDKKNKNIAIFGANGTIGSAMLAHYQNESHVYAFSRSDSDASYSNLDKILLDDYKDKTLARAASAHENDFFDKIIICIGMLHNENFMPEKRIEDFSEKQFMKTMEINTLIPSLIAKNFYKKLKKDEESILAFLSARVGSITDNRTGGWYSYRASKASLNMMVKNFSIELGRYNKKLVVIGLHPGTVDSHLTQPFQKNLEDSKIFSADFSVSKLSSVIDSLSVESSGKCIDWEGKIVFP